MVVIRMDMEIEMEVSGGKFESKLELERGEANANGQWMTTETAL